MRSPSKNTVSLVLIKKGLNRNPQGEIIQFESLEQSKKNFKRDHSIEAFSKKLKKFDQQEYFPYIHQSNQTGQSTHKEEKSAERKPSNIQKLIEKIRGVNPDDARQPNHDYVEMHNYNFETNRTQGIRNLNFSQDVPLYKMANENFTLSNNTL